MVITSAKREGFGPRKRTVGGYQREARAGGGPRSGPLVLASAKREDPGGPRKRTVLARERAA